MNQDISLRFIKYFFITAIIGMLSVIGIVILFDPFYNYHKPLPGLKAVLTDKEYQCIGSLRHFDYDSLIVGSSVCENYDNTWFDEAFQCKTIKAVRSYGATADLCYLLDIAYENHDIKNIFYNIDPSSLSADPVTTYVSTGCPVYLYDKNYLNDFKYIFNKDVIFEKIPYMLASSFSSEYEEGNSFNWAQWKNFNKELCMGMYDRPIEVAPMRAFDQDEVNLQANIQLLTKQVEKHPDTSFYFFFPPYSMLWWDNSYRTGDRDSVLYDEKKCIESLLAYDNVKIFFYQDEEDIITNLDYYMDTIHFSKEINYQIFDKLSRFEDQVTEHNIDSVFDQMYQLSEDINEIHIKKYYN